MASFDYSKIPTLTEQSHVGYMGPKYGERKEPPPAPAPLPALPRITFPQPSTFAAAANVAGPAAPQPPGSLFRSLAGTGAILAVLYAWLALNLPIGGLLVWGVGGLAAGAGVAAAFWMLGKLLKLAVIVLAVAFKIALVVGGFWLLVHFLAN